LPTGPVDVTVTTAAGTSQVSPADQFTITPAGALPTVTAVESASQSFAQGSTEGGQLLTIVGTNFTDVTGVSFGVPGGAGSIAADSWTLVSPTQIRVTAPALAAGTYDLIVTTAAGSSAASSSDLYTAVVPSPRVSGLSQFSVFSSGGESVTIYGAHLGDATSVTFVAPASGGNPATTVTATSFTINHDGSITAILPVWPAQLSAPVTVDVRVMTPEGKTALVDADQLTITPAGALPTITGLSSTSGLTTGGNTVVISGTNFTDVTSVSFGGVAAKSFYVASPTSIIAIAPTFSSAPSAPVDVTVTTSAGTSATSSATEFAVTEPTTGGSSGSSGTTGSSYVVVAAPLGGPPTASLGVTDFNMPSAHGMMTSFVAPTGPTVPKVNPVSTLTEGSSGATATLTDSGTVVYTEGASWVDANGNQLSDLWSDTVTFSYYEKDTGYSPSVDYKHIVREDMIVSYRSLTAPDGSGYTFTSFSDSKVTYDATTSSNGTGNWTIDTTETQNSKEVQNGVSATNTVDQDTETDTENSTSTSHLDATLAGGVIDVNYNTSDKGQDQSIANDLSSTNTSSDVGSETATVKGGDSWNNSDQGTFHQNADKTTTATDVQMQSTGGSDLYVDNANDAITNDSPIDDPGAPGDPTIGDDLLIDSAKGSDVGQDQYSIGTTANASRDTSGNVTIGIGHVNTLSGQEDLNVSDNGNDATNATEPWSSDNLLDNFHSMVDDLSHYSIKDTQTPNSVTYDVNGNVISGAQGIDVLKVHDDDKESFDSGDNETDTIIVTSPAGAVTTITVQAGSSDDGTTNGQDDVTDNETLPADSSTTPTDVVNFDDGSGEQDKASSNTTIQIVTNGLVAPNDEVNSNEKITIEDDATTQENVSDDGNETDGPGGDQEGDLFQDNYQSHDDSKFGDQLQSQETYTGADGSQVINTIQDNANDEDISDEKDITGDQHGAAVGAQTGTAAAAMALAGSAGVSGETDTNHATDNDQSSNTDNATDNSLIDTKTSSPVTMADANGNQVTCGLLQTDDSVEDDYSDNSSDISQNQSTDDSQGNPAGGSSNPASEIWTDDYTDNYSDNPSDTTQTGSISQLKVTDPTTGVVTSISTGDKTKDISSDQFGDQVTDDEGSNTSNGGAVTDNYSELESDDSKDLFTDHGTEDTSVNGSPQAGTTINASSHLVLDETDKDGEQFQDNFTAPDADTGDDKFQTSTDDSVDGKANTTVVNTVNTNDGQGNTANSSVTFTDKSTIGGKDHEDDNGEEDFGDVNGAPATDVENDTDHSNNFAQVFEDVGDQYSGTYGSFDPVTGLSTNTTVNGNDDTHETDTEIDEGKDIHNESGTAAPIIADDLTYDDKVDEEGGSSDYEQVVATTQGTDLQGEQVNLQATITNNANGTNSLSDLDDGADNVSSATGDTGGDTERVLADVQFNETIVQTLTGTIISTDPTTGVQTTTTENDSDTNSSSLHDQEDETDIRTRTPAGETDNDTATQTDTNTQTENWTDSETIAPSNGTPTTTTNTGGNTLNSSVGLQYAPDGSQTSTATGTETGTNTSSDPTVGTTNWTNQTVESTRLSEFASNANRLTNLAPPAAAGAGGGSGSGTSPQASGANAAQAAENEGEKNGGDEQQQKQAKVPQAANNPAIADTKNAAQEVEIKFDPQSIPGDRVASLVKDGLAKEFVRGGRRLILVPFIVGGQVKQAVLEENTDLVASSEYFTTVPNGTYRITTLASPNYNTDALVEYIFDTGNQIGMDLLAGGLTFTLHLLPGATLADYVVNGEGTAGGVAVATVLDVGLGIGAVAKAISVSGKATRTVLILQKTAAGIEIGVGGVQGVQAGVYAYNGDKMAAAGSAGEATMRILLGALVLRGRGVWDLGPGQRGVSIEKRLGQNLPQNYPVLDKFKDGVATSIKSLDLAAESYQDAKTLEQVGRDYVNKIADFKGRKWAGAEVKSKDIQSRVLEIAVPPGATAAQRKALQEIIDHGIENNVLVKIIELK
jgi:hypothetical protein